MCSALWSSETCISQKYVLYYRNLLLILGQNVCTIRTEKKEKNKPKKILCNEYSNVSSLNNIKIISGYPLFKTFNKTTRPIF
jgi:hypothetical protein